MRNYFVGVTQDPTAMSPDAGWIDLAGRPVEVSLWSNFGVNGKEPDDTIDEDEANHEEQLATINLDTSIGHLVDHSGTMGFGIVCECDGKTIHAMAAMYIANDPRNPN